MNDLHSYLDYHIKHKNIKQVSREYTLADGSSFKIDDYSPTAGNDDRFYDKYGYDTLLKRGTACIHTENMADAWLFGLPKFGYATEETKEGALRWYFAEKENGECGHIAFLEDMKHIVIGSKNVHIPFSIQHFSEDLNLYVRLNEERLTYAIRIAKLFQDMCWHPKFIEYMAQTGTVMIMEAIFNNHIVHYDTVGYKVTSFVKQGKVIPLNKVQEVCAVYDLPLVDINVATTTQEYDTLCLRYTQDSGGARDTEGAVVYKEDADGNMSLYKLKNPEYVAKRAARELIKKRATKAQWMERMLNLHVVVHESLLDKLFKFYLWMLKYHPRYTSDFVQDNFAILWKTFTTMVCESDAALNEEELLPDARNTVATVIGFIGIPGCGKTTLSRTLAEFLSRLGEKVVRVNQDEMSHNRKQFIRELDRLEDKFNQHGYIIIDKVNHTPFLRSDIEDRFTNVKWFVFQHENMVDMCLQRIRDRGIYHPTLVYSYKTREILERFHAEMCECSRGIPIDMAETREQQLQVVLQHIQKELNPGYTSRLPSKVIPYANILYWKIDLPYDLHVTLAYKPSATDTDELIPHFGKEVEIEVEYVARTSDVHVAKLKPIPFLEKYCRNRFPHITLWTAEGVAPVLANTILENDLGEKEYVEDMKYVGIVTVELKR